MRKIDVFNHTFPKEFFDKMCETVTNKGAIKRWLNIPFLYDIDMRLKVMDKYDGYCQVLSLSAPPIEMMGGPDATPDLAKLANDGMADMCRQYPERFPSFLASLPMNNPEASVAEMTRAVKDLGACAVQIFSNVNGEPLDEEKYAPIFETAEKLGTWIFLHPTRGAGVPDYPTETKSKYEIWWTFGWPFETSVAMSRMVFSGFFDKWPNLKVLAHHLGAMIPYFEGRIGPGMDQLGSRTADEDYVSLRENMRMRPYDYFKLFYADTAVFGSDGATRCGIDFFGADHVMFASDAPFDPEGGEMYIRETIRILDTIDVSDEDRAKIYHKNAEKLLGLKPE